MPPPRLLQALQRLRNKERTRSGAKTETLRGGEDFLPAQATAKAEFVGVRFPHPRAKERSFPLAPSSLLVRFLSASASESAPDETSFAVSGRRAFPRGRDETSFRTFSLIFLRLALEKTRYAAYCKKRAASSCAVRNGNAARERPKRTERDMRKTTTAITRPHASGAFVRLRESELPLSASAANPRLHSSAVRLRQASKQASK